ncbi:hypothetical protein Nepgr_022558 [Nepenthes gracilis]|uniref:RNA-binding protein 25 n=1 Tax=Nepenthes gracilis TaxID=150966 RepID=A0AAD3T2A4_NEPGR|nr:hypothetical protein Nepgr_022558 [Nepenthes gracilis]
MAEASTPSAVQDLNSQPSEPENLNSQPSNTQSHPDSGEAQTSSSAGAPPLTPNPNTNPNSAMQLLSPPPPSVNPYTPQPAIGSSGSSVPPPAVPSFRPAGAPAPIATSQFIPIPGNPNWQSYQTQNPSAPPPGVSSAPGMMASSVPPPMAPANVYHVPPGQQLNPVMRPPFLAVPSAYMAANVPQAPPGVPRYPFPPMVRPTYLPRPPGAIGMVPSLPRPLIPGIRPPIIPPAVRPPILPIVTPADKPQTTVYVGKIALTVENDFVLSLLQLCGPVKSWKRAQDPSDGTPRGFGFCEFELAEGVLRALRLLSKLNVDGQELVLNVNQATREYLERYVEKKKENLKKLKETEANEAKKEGETADIIKSGEGMNEAPKPSAQESKKDEEESGGKENDMANFGLVTDEDHEADREASEKLINLIEERLKNKPLPPPPAQKVADGTTNSNSEVPTKSGDRDSDVDTVKKDEKNDDETTSEAKTASRAGTESPDRSRRYDSRSRERDRERDLKREKERDLERLERERERERARRERDRELEIQKAERLYKERVKDWEAREKERDYQRKHEKEREKERERERRRLVVDQEDESDDDSRKRRRRSEIEEKRKKRRREKEDDLADRLKEEEEIAEAKKKAEEERQRQQEKEALQLSSAPAANGNEKTVLLEADLDEINHKAAEQTYETDSGHINHIGDGFAENGCNDELAMTPGSTSDVRLSGNALTKKLGFGLPGSGKRTAVPSVFNEEEDDDAHKEKKMRPLVPIDYSTDELQAIQPTVTGATPPNLAAAAEFARSISNANSKEERPDAERERSRRAHDRYRDLVRNDDETSRSRDENREKSIDRNRARDHGLDRTKNSDNKKLIDAKQLIDMIPKTKDELFSYDINWAVYDEHDLHERMRPWISKKITEFLGEEETTLVDYIVSSTQKHVKASQMLELLQSILDEEAEMFVLKMWRMLIFEIKKVETGLASRPKT